jgi:hypothetical protein
MVSSGRNNAASGVTSSAKSPPRTATARSRLLWSMRPTVTPVDLQLWLTSAATLWFSTSGATGVAPATAQCPTWLICTATTKVGRRRSSRSMIGPCNREPNRRTAFARKSFWGGQDRPFRAPLRSPKSKQARQSRPKGDGDHVQAIRDQRLSNPLGN